MRIRLIVAAVAATAIVATLGWFWHASLLPGSYQVTQMGYPDTGGHSGHHGHAGRSLTTLIADPDRPADVAVTLTARQQRFRLPSGRDFDGYTLNGQSPGPVIRAVAGQLVQVTLINESVPDGVTLHWHGIDVPNAEDGVAGVTQDAVGPGKQHVYRFVAGQVGTFWYHSHQLSHRQVARGLLGAVVMNPGEPSSGSDTVALVHLYGGHRTVNGLEADLHVAAEPGKPARVRVINTDNGLLSAWVSGAPFRLVAVDGNDVHEPGPIADLAVTIPAGGRADLEMTMPPDGSPVRVHLGGSVSVVLGGPGANPPAIRKPAAAVDLLTYGTPDVTGFEPAQANRVFRYDIGRRPGFLNGKPGLFWTINGRLYPDIPMYMVAEGDIVLMTVTNRSGETHPMHLHGHHAIVLARNGITASGSPWWTDSLEVGNGESFEIGFLANNPGIWMDHCHNLPHAGQGLMAHVMYEGITTPYELHGLAE